MSSSFADLGVSNAVAKALDLRGIKQPFPVQELVIADVLAGHDVLVQSPTGSGKTLAFGVPMVDRIGPESSAPSALILAPTRELAQQIVDEIEPLAHARALSSRSSTAASASSRRSSGPARPTSWSRRPAVSRICSSAAQSRLDGIEILVLDEADRMLDMGFKPAVDRIVRQMPAKRQTLFFSATLEGAGRRGRLELHRQRQAPRPRADREAARRRSSIASCSCRRPGDKIDALRQRASRHGPRPDARLRPHQARRRPARQAARARRT